jgi:poly [ADP-ribose] polymerase
MVSKSANDCHATRHSDVQCMLLCQVALGDMNELLQADYHASNLPAGKLSTKGCGVNYPDPAQNLVLPSGTIVPLGKEKRTEILGSSLLYNEFVVYNVSQINRQNEVQV